MSSSAAKTITILGVTGSIGRSACDVIAASPGRFHVQAVTACNNAEDLADRAIKLKAKKAVLADPAHFKILQERLTGTGIEALAGQDALLDAASEKVDITLAAIIGIAGLAPLMRAIENSKAVAIANKEPLVAAGPLVIAAARKHKTQLLPVDSEHNAIFQVFDEARKNAVEKIILTASGGPFLRWNVEQVRNATPAQALAHPNWSMGRKISIDSATMMNKALEIIEAHYLFDVAPEKIEVLIHPQSVVHSMVEYTDGSVLAQMGASDMRTPLSHVLAWPDRLPTPGEKLDFSKSRSLNFEPPNPDQFPAIGLAYRVLKQGPYACVALNAANEVAVDAFLGNKISFPAIMECIEYTLGSISKREINTLDDVGYFDKDVRMLAQSYINNNATTTRTVSAL
jgi:1-deoxy-D-xylulose-5-phosphate reductoisomerase